MEYEADLEPTGPQVTVREVSADKQTKKKKKKKKSTTSVLTKVTCTLPPDGSIPSQLQTQLRRFSIRQFPATSNASRNPNNVHRHCRGGNKHISSSRRIHRPPTRPTPPQLLQLRPRYPIHTRLRVRESLLTM